MRSALNSGVVRRLRRAISAMGRMTSVVSVRRSCCCLAVSPLVSRSFAFCSTACVLKLAMTSSSRLRAAVKSTALVSSVTYSSMKPSARCSALRTAFCRVNIRVSPVKVAAMDDAKVCAGPAWTACVAGDAFRRWEAVAQAMEVLSASSVSSTR